MPCRDVAIWRDTFPGDGRFWGRRKPNFLAAFDADFHSARIMNGIIIQENIRSLSVAGNFE